MPNIDLIPVPLYESYFPYHWEYDNLPLKSILSRINLINGALDNVVVVVEESSGSAGSLSNRLNQSLDSNGNLKKASIDAALHSIEEHEDTNDYVRMTKAERDKLSLITEESVKIDIQFNTVSEIINFPFDSELLEYADSDSIAWRYEDGKMYADTTFPTTFLHQHNYGLTPITSDYVTYQTTSISTPFIDGSLRVFINGVRIYENDEIYVPGATPTDDWISLSFTPNPSLGSFELSTAITSSDIIKIDFDVEF